MSVSVTVQCSWQTSYEHRWTEMTQSFMWHFRSCLRDPTLVLWRLGVPFYDGMNTGLRYRNQAGARAANRNTDIWIRMEVSLDGTSCLGCRVEVRFHGISFISWNRLKLQITQTALTRCEANMPPSSPHLAWVMAEMFPTSLAKSRKVFRVKR